MSSGYADRLLNLPRYSELGNAAMKPGLRGVSHLLGAMGNPERRFASVHIAGTNGKGSVASQIAAIGQVAGYRIGLYTSPHLLHLSERIRLNGTPVPDAWMENAVDRHGSLFKELQPSFFEAMTALGFLFFAESFVDLAVVETGLGGRLDATNILRPKLTVITQIDMDHTQTLGNSLTSITSEKAGILKENTPVLAATGRTATQSIVQNIARRLNASWIEPGKLINNSLHTPNHIYELPPNDRQPHEVSNALLAARSAELLFPEIKYDPDLVLQGLSRVRELTGLRARLEILNQAPLTILDVAHNPAGIAAALNRTPNNGNVFLLLSLMKDKDLPGIAHVLKAYPSLKIYVCELELRRVCPAADLSNLLRTKALNVVKMGSVPAMWSLVQARASKDDTILICGSHFLAEAFLRTCK
ncbi:MAG: bifunctional folylpolyglutamate synthase/dihydrofolate synthase [Bacteroidetes bacterium]|nr:bifunctional folylpolyglutamate synthase/dihydrofolate synthase [Bacteroidota bacterium]MCY4205106.1 bifunctional folylpolyglutamate synthase/dihydrofolate synthase [Bacteroidota bacterium]